MSFLVDVESPDSSRNTRAAKYLGGGKELFTALVSGVTARKKEIYSLELLVCRVPLTSTASSKDEPLLLPKRSFGSGSGSANGC